jgi:APA family basic amino acid/polyamine antiporter
MKILYLQRGTRPAPFPARTSMQCRFAGRCKRPRQARKTWAGSMDRPAGSADRPRAGAGEAVPQPAIGLRAAVMLIVGIVIGAGIFKSPALVAGFAGGTEWMFAAWLAGGLVSLAGALCYAELATAYSHAGGEYHFLHRAYGRSTAFLFGWARLSVITTGSIALIAFVFGDYMQQLAPLHFAGPGAGPAVYAFVIVMAVSVVNLFGIKAGSAAQNWLTAAEIGGLVLIVAAAALFDGDDAARASPPAAAASGSFGLAMVFVLLTYGGWNEAAYLSAEVRDGHRNMVRALTCSIAVITVLYLLVIWAYWRVLGTSRMAASPAVAAEAMRIALGPAGDVLMSLLVAVSALTSINATVIVGARTSYALGRDWRVLAPLGRWNAKRGTPHVALVLQCLATLLLVAMGAAVGGGFRSMVEFTAPVFWLFFLMSGAALFVLRRREPAMPRPFRVPLYPLLPLLFCGVCGYMLWSSLSYVHRQEVGGWNAAWVGVMVLALGAVLLLPMRLYPGKHGTPPFSPTDNEESRR